MHYLGDERLLKTAKIAILNSRQSKTPTGADQWMQNSYRAISDAVNRGKTILTSLGMNTWEFLVWAVGDCGGAQIIVLPLDERDDETRLVEHIICDFELDPYNTAFMFFRAHHHGGRGKGAWQERDRAVLSLANEVYPISMRPGGALERLLTEFPGKLAAAAMDYSVPYDPRTRTQNVVVRAERLSDTIRKISWDYLTHYTRSSYISWPGENAACFYRDLFRAGDRYPRNGLESLKHIISTRKIWGTFYHIRGGFKVVSFTELPPDEAVGLIRWRPRYVRWNFEPYGVAIEKDCARRLGIRRVIYAPPEEYDKLSREDKPFYQNPGEKGGDWKPEKEWRFPGNLDLCGIPPEAIRVLVRTRSEIFDCEYTQIPFLETN